MKNEEVVIVGAGPYGLSVAANLRKLRVPFRIFGRQMEMWAERMPRGMLLKSDGCATNLGGMPLTLEKFCRQTGRRYTDTGHRVPVADMIAYGKTFADEYVGPVENQRVEEVTHTFAGFQVRLQSGEKLRAKRVVLATGLYYLEQLPRIPGLGGHMTHTSVHGDLSGFASQRVAVIGRGQSALETAALLHEGGAEQVTLLSRSGVRWFGPDPVSTAWRRVRSPYFGLSPGWHAWLWSSPNLFARLPQNFRLAKAYSTFEPGGTDWIRTRLQHVPGVRLLVGQITQADPAGNGVTLRLTDGRAIDVDHVVAGTGYVPDLQRVAFLSSLMKNIRWITPGIPALTREFETSVPGLHVVGYLAAGSLGPSMRFVYGTRFAGPIISSLYVRQGRSAVPLGALRYRAVVAGRS